MSIMEKNLPNANSIESGDYVRIVTSGGNSQKVLASEIGGGGLFICTMTEGSDSSYSIDKSYQEILDAYNSGMFPVVVMDTNTSITIMPVMGMQHTNCPGDDDTTVYVVTFALMSSSPTIMPLYATTATDPMTSTNPCGGGGGGGGGFSDITT